MERDTLWADEIILKSSNNLDECIEVYKYYDTEDTQYEDMFIMDNLTDKVIYG